MDVLSQVKSLEKAPGLVAPNQLKVVQGPGIRINNAFSHEKLENLSMSGHALNKGGKK